MDMQWRQQVSEEMRKQMITEMYHELLRISGEQDKQKVWGSAAKFELMLWSNSPDRNTYLTKMQRKILHLKKKPVTSSNPPTQNQTQTQPQASAPMPSQATINSTSSSMMAGLTPQQHLLYQQQLQQQQQQQQANNMYHPQSAAISPNTNSPSNPVPVTTSQQNNAKQAAQQWLQRLQAQFQAQQQQLLHEQQQETQALRQQQLNQQQQLAQQHQDVAPEIRRQQLQQLQQQHQLARSRLQHLQKLKIQQLQRKQQQYLLQRRQLQQQQANDQSKHVNQMQTSLQQQSNSSNVKPEVLDEARQHQADTRAMQRMQNAAEAAQTGGSNNAFGTSPIMNTAAKPDSNYAERLNEIRTKYFDDLILVYREFERMVKQKPVNPQQDRIANFLLNLKRIISLLQQDPTKSTNNNKNDLDRVEDHIRKQVLPILERLRSKARAASSGTINNGNASSPAPLNSSPSPSSLAVQQEQQKKLQEQQRLQILQEQQKKMLDQQRKLLEDQRNLQDQKKAQIEQAKKHQEMLEQQRKQKQQVIQAQQQQRQQMQQLQAQQRQEQSFADQQARSIAPSAMNTTPSISTPVILPANPVMPSNDINPSSMDFANAKTFEQVAASLTVTQYRTFKLTEAQRARLTAEYAKLREQKKDILLQQSRSTTAVQQTKLLQQSQRIDQILNKIAQQLVQGKLAEKFEQLQNAKLHSSSSPSPDIPSVEQKTPEAALVSLEREEKPQVKNENAQSDPIGQVQSGTKSVVPDLTGLGASEKLLTAVAAYEKHQPEVLKRAASRFSAIAIRIGAKLELSFDKVQPISSAT